MIIIIYNTDKWLIEIKAMYATMINNDNTMEKPDSLENTTVNKSRNVMKGGNYKCQQRCAREMSAYNTGHNLL